MQQDIFRFAPTVESTDRFNQDYVKLFNGLNSMQQVCGGNFRQSLITIVELDPKAVIMLPTTYTVQHLLINIVSYLVIGRSTTSDHKLVVGITFIPPFGLSYKTVKNNFLIPLLKLMANVSTFVKLQEIEVKYGGMRGTYEKCKTEYCRLPIFEYSKIIQKNSLTKKAATSLDALMKNTVLMFKSQLIQHTNPEMIFIESCSESERQRWLNTYNRDTHMFDMWQIIINENYQDVFPEAPSIQTIRMMFNFCQEQLLAVYEATFGTFLQQYSYTPNGIQFLNAQVKQLSNAKILDIFGYHPTYIIPIICSLVHISKIMLQKSFPTNNKMQLFLWDVSGSGKSAIMNILSRLGGYRWNQKEHQNDAIRTASYICIEELSPRYFAQNYEVMKELLDMNSTTNIQIKYKDHTQQTRNIPVVLTSNKSLQQVFDAIQNPSAGITMVSEDRQAFVRRIQCLRFRSAYDEFHGQTFMTHNNLSSLSHYYSNQEQFYSEAINFMVAYAMTAPGGDELQIPPTLRIHLQDELHTTPVGRLLSDPSTRNCFDCIIDCYTELDTEVKTSIYDEMLIIMGKQLHSMYNQMLPMFLQSTNTINTYADKLHTLHDNTHLWKRLTNNKFTYSKLYVDRQEEEVKNDGTFNNEFAFLYSQEALKKDSLGQIRDKYTSNLKNLILYDSDNEMFQNRSQDTMFSRPHKPSLDDSLNINHNE